MTNAAIYKAWKIGKILGDEKIIEQMNQMARPYGYCIEEGFSIHIRKERKGYFEEKYAELAFSAGEFTISTVSSHWGVSEATVFMKQLKAATEIAAELNIFLAALDRTWKEEYENEMKRREEEHNGTANQDA